MGYTQEVLESYNEQVRKVFVPPSVTVRPEEFEVLRKHNAGSPDNQNGAQLLYVDGGLFTDCCLERPVYNTLYTPTRSLGNRIPVMRKNTQISKYAYLTDIEDPVGGLPEFACDVPPQIGDINACMMTTEKGRTSLRTKTMEMDRIIQRYCEGITGDLFLVGDIRGVSDFIAPGMQGNLSLLAGAAVRRQMQLLGRGMQRKILQQFWTGDPTNAALNTVGGGEKQFWGMEHLVADDYGTAAKPYVTGTNCERLNSDIKNFEFTCIGAANATTGLGLYSYMQELESTLTMKASLSGYVNIDWVWVMSPVAWSCIVKYLPCEMLSGNCHAPLVGTSPGAPNVNNTPISINIDSMGIATVRQNLQQSMRIDVNGRTYMVILDDSLPVTKTPGTPATHDSDIYFLALRVEGQPVKFWDSADYRAVSQALQPIPGGLGSMHGWTDGGFFLNTVQHLNYCFEVTTKTELGVVNLTPFLDGRINNVRCCALQEKPLAFD